MKATRIIAIAAIASISASLRIQAQQDQLIEPVIDLTDELRAKSPADGSLPPPSLPAGADVNVVAPPPAGGNSELDTSSAPIEDPQQEMQQSDQGFIIKDAGLNDIFQFLAKSAGRQYFHNSKIVGPDFMVTGHLNDGNPLQQMEELAFMYGLSLHTKGNTIYALTQAQLSQLPSAEFHYQLRYLRPTDMEQIKELIKPILSPGTGIVNFEPKTNTIVIIDAAHRIEAARMLLQKVDQVKGQIVVETKILRVNNNAAERTGVNWAGSLGTDGTSLSIARDLNSIFGLPSSPLFTDAGGESTNLVLSPLRLSGVLRALAEGNVANQIANPSLITEDNEQASISIIDRVPIITTSTTQNSGNTDNPTVTEEVRYRIDTADKTIDQDPSNHREIGISLVVTPTLLPDGTIRMRMRPRSAQIVEEIESLSGNKYPRVAESMVESLARVPDGHSLIVGGFYGESEQRDRNKIPIIGDIPVINFFFKSKESIKEQASLVFVVTPKSYNPASISATREAKNQLRSSTDIGCEGDWVDPQNPGPAHEPNMARSLRGLIPQQAPLFPESPDAFVPADLKGKPRFARGHRP